MDIKKEWENLLIDNSIAENHNWICGDHKNLKISEVESVIVSGLLIRAISLLDCALEIYIDKNNIEIQNRNPKLFDRLKALNNANILVDYDDIDFWRRRRNDVGHKVNEVYNWNELKGCLISIFRELKNIDILDAYPEMKTEKTIQRVTPTIEGIKIEQNIIVKICDAEKVYYQFGWKLSV